VAGDEQGRALLASIAVPWQTALTRSTVPFTLGHVAQSELTNNECHDCRYEIIELVREQCR
jgi:hypothetical protein